MREVGAPTEVEVLRLFGVSAAQLALKKLEVVSEDNATLAVFPIDLYGLPAHKVGSMRKLRMSSAVAIAHEEHFVVPSEQLTDDQGQKWLRYLQSQHVSKRNSQVVFKGQHAAQTYEALHARSCEIRGVLTEQQQATYEREPEPVGDDENAEAMKVEPGDEDEDAFLSAKRPRREDPAELLRKAAGDSSRGRAPRGGRARGGGRGGRSANTRKKKRAGEDAEASDADQAGEDADVPELDYEILKARDPEMHEVAEKHLELTCKRSQCFFDLGVARYLHSEKLGQTIVGAT